MVTGQNGQSGLHVISHAMMVELKDGGIAQTLSRFMEGEHVVANQRTRNTAIKKNVLVFIFHFLTSMTNRGKSNRNFRPMSLDAVQVLAI